MDATRRALLARSAALAALMGSLGLLPRAAQAAWTAAAFEAKTPADALKALGLGAPAQSAEVTLTGPDIAENGAVVPLVLSSSAPGVKRLIALVEKNPFPLAAMFDVSDAIEPNFSTRVKMGQSSDVMAVAVLGDGKVLYAHKEIKVTLGGCGG